MYSVKEIYYTLQGEGKQSGRPAVFLRFSGCNLWSGREQDREMAICRFCDTDFVGTKGADGGKYKKASDLVELVKSKWPSDKNNIRPYVVCTGGEPLLQLDDEISCCCMFKIIHCSLILQLIFVVGYCNKFLLFVYVISCCNWLLQLVVVMSY